MNFGMANTCFYYLRIALGAWPPTTYITLGKPIGVLGRVLGDCTDDRCSLLSRWYFIASIRKSLHMLLFLTSISVSTRLTRYSRDSRGRRTCSMSWAKQSCLCSGSWFTHVTTASNTWNKKFLSFMFEFTQWKRKARKWWNQVQYHLCVLYVAHVSVAWCDLEWLSSPALHP